MNNSNLAPIVLFVYNRPWHTLQTLVALSKNDLASESVLYIYADGIKDDLDATATEKINETRKTIREKQWCKEVHIIESDTNKGLADSIVGGVTDIVNKYGKIIVLEDDIVTSSSFLTYMNEALYLYENEEQVMHISGFAPELKQASELPETYFLKLSSCWGWATWKRAWDKFIPDAHFIKEQVEEKKLVEKFNFGGAHNWFSQIEKNVNGTLKTWAIKWYGAVFLNNGLCLYPRYSLVNNIGFDGSGTHDKGEGSYETSLVGQINVEFTKIEENEAAKEQTRMFYQKGNEVKKQSFVSRLRNKLKRILG